MNASSRPAVEVVLAQHLEDAISLRTTRSMLVRAPHVALRHLARADERLAAHLDGLSVGGDAARAMARAALDLPGVGQLFVCAVLAIEQHDSAQIERLLALVPIAPDAWRALGSAFGWVSSSQLRGFSADLLNSASAPARRLAMAACAQHRADPGGVLTAAVADDDPGLCESALRLAGVLGRVDLLPACIARLDDPSPAVASTATSAAWLLGERERTVEPLQRRALTPGLQQFEAVMLLLLGADPGSARALIQGMVTAGAPPRLVIRAAGWSGDPQVVPWLLKQMEDPLLARIAGEAFSFVSGADLAALDLEDNPSANTPVGPNDDPDDVDVALDEDEGLPWPDVERISTWWRLHSNRFQPGTRYFVGESPSASHCLAILKSGYQRQRIIAAKYLCMAHPGTPLFNTAAPASRQERLLAQMSV